MFLRQIGQNRVGLTQRESAVGLLDAGNGAARIFRQIIGVSAATYAAVPGIDQFHFKRLLL